MDLWALFSTVLGGLAAAWAPKAPEEHQSRGCPWGISGEEGSGIRVCVYLRVSPQRTMQPNYWIKWGVEKVGVSGTNKTLITTQEFYSPCRLCKVSAGSCPSAALLLLLKHVDHYLLLGLTPSCLFCYFHCDMTALPAAFLPLSSQNMTGKYLSL